MKSGEKRVEKQEILAFRVSSDNFSKSLCNAVE
jgi:hypothetical protein